jgi:integrase
LLRLLNFNPNFIDGKRRACPWVLQFALHSGPTYAALGPSKNIDPFLFLPSPTVILRGGILPDVAPEVPAQSLEIFPESRGMDNYLVNCIHGRCGIDEHFLATADWLRFLDTEAIEAATLANYTKADKRGAAKLQIGVDGPTREEIARIVAAASGRARPFLITVIFTGMRASELRGLRWSDVDFSKGKTVRQRADRFNRIGNPKSASSRRTIPIGPMVTNSLREWKLACPEGGLDLVFPNDRSNVQQHGNVFLRWLRPTLAAAGVTNQYGLHSFRNFFASWCANRKVDGGRELPLQTVQQLLGQATISMTADRYSHFFPRSDDSAELAAAESDLIAVR